MIGAPADYDLTVSVPATVAEQGCGLGQEPGEAGGLNSSGTSSRNTSEWIVRIAAPMPVRTALKSKSALGRVSCRPAASRLPDSRYGGQIINIPRHPLNVLNRTREINARPIAFRGAGGSPAIRSCGSVAIQTLRAPRDCRGFPRTAPASLDHEHGSLLASVRRH